MKWLIVVAILLISICAIAQNKTDTTNSRKKWRIGVTFSPDYCYRQIDSTEIINSYGPTRNYIMHVRDSTETPKFGYTTGITFGCDVSSKVTVEFGILLSNKGYQTLVFHPNALSYSGGGVKFIYSYYYLEIPIKVDVSVFQSKKFRGYIYGGIVPDHFLKAVNTTVQYNNANTTSSSDDLNQYTTKNISILAGIGADYKLNNSFSIRAEPLFKRLMIRIIDAPITAYLWNAGINIGVDYHF